MPVLPVLFTRGHVMHILASFVLQAKDHPWVLRQLYMGQYAHMSITSADPHVNGLMK